MSPISPDWTGLIGWTAPQHLNRHTSRSRSCRWAAFTLASRSPRYFRGHGVEVTIVTRRGLLPEAEPEVSETLTKAFSDEGIKVLDGIS